ncbi:hypothetical protein [Nonomuraea sp. NPDC005650]|uniref:hypothetical protein n=1 Tax=Nonomuraea sp. NPDC005650 TaxID=3157045 RepID=UPI0033A910B1
MNVPEPSTLTAWLVMKLAREEDGAEEVFVPPAVPQALRFEQAVGNVVRACSGRGDHVGVMS